MKTILITGGTGIIGKALSQALIQRGFSVIILTRHPAVQKQGSDRLVYAHWDPYKKEINKDAFSKADVIIHLAGASVAEKRWTKKRKREIVDSRVESGKFIVDCIRSLPNKIATVISASAIGWYGPDKVTGENPFTEDDPPSNDFLGQTCFKWESAICPVKEFNKRLVTLRIGIVMSEEGGALKEFKKPLEYGIAAILGNGKQMISWIHMEDLVRIFLFMIDNDKLSGIYNAVAPQPVTNKELVLKIAKKYRKRFYLPAYVPAFILQLALGEMSVEVLKSATVSSSKIQKEKFIFQFSQIDDLVNSR